MNTDNLVPRRRSFISLRARQALLLVATCLGLAQFAGAVDEPALVPGLVPRPTLNGPHDTNPADRMTGFLGVASPYMTENYKQNFLRELARQQALYPNQMAGASFPPGVPVWQSIGPRSANYEWDFVYTPGIDSGRVRTILSDPADADHVFVLTSGGGLWVTRNFSAAQPHWDVLTDALLSTSGGSVAFGRDARTLYLGVGDPFDIYPTVAGVIVKSTDGGRTWGPFANLPGATSVRDVKVDTSGAQDVVLVATDAGLFLSNDGGATYSLSSAGQSAGVYSAWSIARSSAGWLVSAVSPFADVENPDFSGGTGDLYLSQDHGASWAPIASASDVFTTVARATLAVAAPGEATVYAIAATPDLFAQADVYRSADGGLTWTALNVTANAPSNPNCDQPDLNILGDQAWYNQMIAVSPADPSRNTVYIGGNVSTAKTQDGGAHWTLVSNWLPGFQFYCYATPPGPLLPYVHADQHAAEIRVVGGVERIVYGNDGGIFVSQDGAGSFDSSKNVGIDAFLAETIASTPHREDSAIIGLQDTGTRARIGRSKIWNQVYGGDGEGVAWSQANNAITLVSAEYMSIARQAGLPANTGDPNNWLDGTNGIDFLDPFDYIPFFTPLATPTAKADPTGLVFYTSTGSHVYRTTDGAASWNSVTHFQADYPPYGLQSALVIRPIWHPIGLHPTDGQSLALAGTGGRALISGDGGATWGVSSLNTLVPGFFSYTTSPSWARNGTLYMASEQPAPGAVRVVKTADRGATWHRAAAGLPDVAVNDLAVDPRDKKGHTVYAATSIGVYVTHDGGAHWRLFGAGLPNVSVRSLYISPDEDFMRIATYGRGAWEIDLQCELDNRGDFRCRGS
jgi:photosystem II stability/assembly factor-like uncharacterized protein